LTPFTSTRSAQAKTPNHPPETLATDDLKERLRKVEGSVEYGADPGGTVTCWHRNPDGLEALAHIEALEQHVSELVEALQEAVPYQQEAVSYQQEAVSYHDGPTYAWILRAKQVLAKARNREPNP
jgi:hypothetical protein